MDLTPDLAATYKDLSPQARRYLDFVGEDPEGVRRLDYDGVEYPEWLRSHKGRYYPVQTWPTFAGEDKLKDLRRATVGVTRLIKSIPERVFHNDPKRIAEFYRLRSEFLAALILAPPNGFERAVVRNDSIDTLTGFKCLEVNAGNVGGWQLRFFARACLSFPPTARFIAQEGFVAHHHDPFRTLLLNVLEDNQRAPVDSSGTVNVAIVIPGFSPETSLSTRLLNEVYQTLLRQSGRGIEGEVVVCSYFDLSPRQGGLYSKSLRLHGLVEQTGSAAPDYVFRCFKAGGVKLYNGLASQMIGDKRNLALLSELEGSGLFDDEERSLIRNYIPWSRPVDSREATFRDDTAPLPELAVRHREHLVLKPGFGSRGGGVHVGRHTEPESWRELVSAALGKRGWLLQELLESRPYLFQHGEEGYAVHDLVWGLFCFGDLYGGGFLRMIPRGSGDGVINSARGATEGLIFEVARPGGPA